MTYLAALLWLALTALAAEPSPCREVDAHFVLPQTSDGQVVGATASAMSKAFGSRAGASHRFRVTLSRCPSGTQPSAEPANCTPSVPSVADRRPLGEAWDRVIFLTDAQVARGVGPCNIEMSDLDQRVVVRCEGTGGQETFAEALGWMLDGDVALDGKDACSAAPEASAASESGYGRGGGDFVPKDAGGSAGVGGDPTILGSLDRSLINEVVKRHMSQIRYCYQRELTKNPALSGRVSIQFTISGDGTVAASAVESTTLNNPAVESCIEGRFKRMQFPQPKGGGIVIVTYPFKFEAP